MIAKHLSCKNLLLQGEEFVKCVLVYIWIAVSPTAKDVGK